MFNKSYTASVCVCVQESADLIELAYSNYANAQQRSMLVNEFYGPSFAVFQVFVCFVLCLLLSQFSNENAF